MLGFFIFYFIFYIHIVFYTDVIAGNCCYSWQLKKLTGVNLIRSGCSSNYDDLFSTHAALSGLLHCGIMLVKCRMIHCALCVFVEKLECTRVGNLLRSTGVCSCCIIDMHCTFHSLIAYIYCCMSFILHSLHWGQHAYSMACDGG
jgi:hypothetical protein